MIGGPLSMAIGFGLMGLWIVFLLLPGLRRPPPGCEPKICPHCNQSNTSDAEMCKGCDTLLPKIT